MRLARSWLLAPLCFASLQGDEEIVREFQRYFRQYPDSSTRVEAVLALSGLEAPSVVEALVPVLKDAEPDVADAVVRVLAGFETRPPADALLAELAAQRHEEVRIGLLRAAAEARYAGTADAALPLLGDAAWRVRLHAARALCRSGDERAAEALGPLCADPEDAVRCGALDALSETGSPAVLDPARVALADARWQVRASAIAALGRVRDKASIPLLIDRLEQEEGRLKADAAAALASLTGRGFGERAELWRRFWEANGERYELPSAAELEVLRRKQAEAGEKYAAQGAVSYHGIETPSRRVVFVIDVSGSMEQSVMDKQRFQDGGYPSLHRIDIVKTELARTIERLEPTVQFNILAFATEVRPWKKRLVAANVLNKSSALAWTGRLEAIGGDSKRGLAEVGLVNAADVEGGKTNSHGALMAALGVESGSRSETYAVDADTVFFLSDGRPSHGEYTVPEDILREVAEANGLRKVVIHAISIGDVQIEFMRQLAQQNGGQFVDLGR